MSGSPNDPEPAPTGNDRRPSWELVIEDMQERDRIGREKYGEPLQALNGRDPLTDAYQECLDQAVYLRTAIEERAVTRAVLSEASVALECDL